MEERLKERQYIMRLARGERLFNPPTIRAGTKKPSVRQFNNSLTHLLHDHVDTHLHPRDRLHHKDIVNQATGGEVLLKEDSHNALMEGMFGKYSTTITRVLKSNEDLKKMAQHLETKYPQLETVAEDMDLHKYGAMVEASYKHYAGEDPTKFLKGHFLDELHDFVVDKELSTIDNLVLHNPVTNEVHLALRGTQKLSDWTGANIQAMASVENRVPLVKSAIRTAEQIAEKYGIENFTTSGHSMGGMRSLEVVHHFAEKLGAHIRGFHFDPGASVRQMIRQSKVAKGVQKVFRTHFDAPSAVVNMAQLKTPKNLEINNVATSPEVSGKTPILDTHSTSHFNLKNIIGITKEGKVLVTRHTPTKIVANALRSGDNALKMVANSKAFQVAKPIFHGVGKVLEKGAKPLAVAGVAYDIYNDITDPTKSATEKETDVSVDVATGVASWEGANMAGELAMGATLLLCPECALASVIVGLGAGVGAGYGIAKAGEKLKKPLETVAGAVEEEVGAGEKAFGKFEDEITGTKDFAKQAKEYDIYDAGDDIKSGVEKIGKFFKGLG